MQLALYLIALLSAFVELRDPDNKYSGSQGISTVVPGTLALAGVVQNLRMMKDIFPRSFGPCISNVLTCGTGIYSC